ncbi:MAG: response regulator [Phycisphaerae bacterium]|nr:response regulator [Phycisphaerae bacterium]
MSEFECEPRTVPSGPILVVDDDSDFAASMVDLLTAEQYDVRVAGSAAEALSLVEVWDIPVALVDMRLGDDDGVRLIEQIHEVRPDARCIIVTGHAQLTSTVAAMRAGTYDYLRKPVQPAVLIGAVRRAWNHWQLARREVAARGQLRETTARLQMALVAAGEGTWDWNIESGKVEFDQAALDMLGYHEGAPDSSWDYWLEQVHPDDRAGLDDALRQHFDGETKVYQAVSRLRTSNGGWKWIETRGQVMEWAPDGTPRRMFGVHRDEGELRRTEERLLISERRFQTIVETAQDAVITSDSKGKINYWNNAAARMLGFSETEAIGGNVMDLIVPPQYHEAKRRGMQGFAQTGRGAAVGNTLELTAIRKGGEEFPIEISISGYRVGDSHHAVAILRDITERKRTQTKLFNSEARLAATLDAVQVGIVVVDQSSHCIVDVNPTACEIAGRTRETMVGQRCYNTICQAHPGGCPVTDKGEKVSRAECMLVRADGSQVPIIKSVVSAELDGRQHLIDCFVDISDQKRAERELARAKEAAENATRAKSEFLANMSHEIRTPLTAIIGFAEALLATDMSAAERFDAARTVHRNGRYLLQIINDILDLSKIEAGRMEMAYCDCPPCEVVAEIASLMQVRAESKGLQLKCDYAGPIPATIRSDPVRLRQILLNLVGNAIKFTEVGCVQLHASLHSEDSGHMLYFDVLDTGPGMTPSQTERLFKPFSQVDTSASRKYGGTGLGLALSRRMAQALGGDVELIESSPGRGSRFRARVATGSLDGVQLLDDPAGATIVRPEAVGDPGVSNTAVNLKCRVLLAEDGPDNRRLLKHILSKCGADVTLAENGQEAVQATNAAREAGTPFDVILMDMQMPLVDGYEATRQLREQGFDLPIIALTANAMDGDRSRCIAAGCSDYVSKPIDRKALVAAMQAALAPTKAGPALVGN